MNHIAIFASGTGTNAQTIINYFRNHPFITVSLIVSNNPKAGVLSVAEKQNIPFIIIEKERLINGDGYVKKLCDTKIDFIVLAGFLWKIPITLIEAYPNKIINIHPALLPKYGGKGFYGHFVHEAVITAKEKESGITIHYVDEIYDHGQHIFQEKVRIEEDDTPQTLAKKVQDLEHLYYPKILEEVIRMQNQR